MAVADHSTHLTCGATGLEAVDISAADHTPSGQARWLYVGTTGDVKVDVTDAHGTTTTATINSVASGALIPFAFLTKVYKTGTTASNMTVFW